MRQIVFGLLLVLLPTASFSDEARTEEEIKRLVLQTIREHPEIVMEAVAILERRQLEAQAAAQEQALDMYRDALERDPNAPVLGNLDGDVTMVEFFDYNCPYCKKAMTEVRSLLDSDQNVRLVYREWPILGDGSIVAAKAALASRNQGKYEDFHWALMGFNGPIKEATVFRIAQEIGLDLDRLRADMEAPEIIEHIETSMRLSQVFGFNGTPSFVIGDELAGGFVEKEQLEAFVENARARNH